VIVFTSSCKKNEQSPEIGEKEKKTELAYELVTTQTNVNTLLSTKENIEQIFPGQILSVDTSDNLAKVSLFKNYTKLPVRILTHGTYDILNAVPSFDNLRNFMQREDIKNQRFSGGRGGMGLRIYDYNIVFNIFGTNEELKTFSKLWPLSDTSSPVADNVSVLINFQQQINNSSIMELPRKDELISMEEQKKLASTENLYYVNTVDYGYIYIWLLEGKTDENSLKTTFRKVFAGEMLNSDDNKILEEATLSVYVRSSNEKDPLIKQAKGIKSITALQREFNQWINNPDVSYDYPISFSMRSLENYASFQYTFKNKVYFPKE